MPISVTPTIPVIAAQGAAPDLVPQPGTVVDAEVLKIISADLVRIAINSLSIDVLSEVPLQVGQSLRLAVSQTAAQLSQVLNKAELKPSDIVIRDSAMKSRRSFTTRS